jgi:hypothetical protein
MASRENAWEMDVKVVFVVAIAALGLAFARYTVPVVFITG